jgi:hypothetical protein
MPRFPVREADILALAEDMINGMAENEDFPSPPLSTSDLRNLRDAFLSASNAQVVSKAVAEQATETKQAALEAFLVGMKTMLHYAEDAVHGNDAKLSAIGWGGTAPVTPLQSPGQPIGLTAAQQGEGWLRLTWKHSAEGGITAFYKIERREPTDGGVWVLVGAVNETEATLNNQEHGKVWEYRVIASNKAGESLPSNTVVAVL